MIENEAKTASQRRREEPGFGVSVFVNLSITLVGNWKWMTSVEGIQPRRELSASDTRSDVG